MRSWLVGIFGLCLSAFFMYLSFEKVNRVEFFAELDQLSLYPFFLAQIAYIPSIIVSGLKWGVVVRSEGISAVNAVRTEFLRFFANNVLPSRIGEFVRVFDVGTRGGGVARAFGLTFVDRMIDCTSVVLAGIIGLIFMPPIMGEIIRNYLTTGIVMFGVITTVLIIIWRVRVEDFLPKAIRNRVIAALPSFARNSIHDIRAAMTDFTYSRAAQAISLSFISWCLRSLTFRLSMMLAVPDITLPVCIIVMVLMAATSILPSAPGYVGANHFVMATVLGSYGVGPSKAVVIAIIAHLAWFIPQVTLGGIEAASDRHRFARFLTWAKNLRNPPKLEADPKPAL